MSETGNQSRQGGVGFLGLLTILFIALKLTNLIAWSWFWVLSPILLPMLFGLIIFALCGSVILLAKLVGGK